MLNERNMSPRANARLRPFYIITGGPGSGKTTLIDSLRSRHHTCSVEAGRGIIQDQMLIHGRALPWMDPLLFAELMLAWEMRSYHLAKQSSGPVFFDRGVPDVLRYLRLTNIPALEHMRKAARAFPTTERSSLLHPGLKSSTRIWSANRISTRLNGHMARWWRPTTACTTTSSNCRASRLQNVASSSSTASAGRVKIDRASPTDASVGWRSPWSFLNKLGVCGLLQ